MILEAFWKGDRDALGWLTEAAVANALVEAIDARAAAGHTLETRLDSIERAEITTAQPHGRIPQKQVSYDAATAARTRHADGNLVAGSPPAPRTPHPVPTLSLPPN